MARQAKHRYWGSPDSRVSTTRASENPSSLFPTRLNSLRTQSHHAGAAQSPERGLDSRAIRVLGATAVRGVEAVRGLASIWRALFQAPIALVRVGARAATFTRGSTRAWARVRPTPWSR